MMRRDEEVKEVKEETIILRRIILSAFLWIRNYTRSKVQVLNVAVEKLVEVGFVKEL
jgi:KUP system potassium uptake protein